MVDTRSDMQFSDFDSKPHDGKSLRNIIDRAISAQLYPPPGSVQYKIICLGQFHGPTHINCEQKKTSEIEITIYLMHTIVLQNPAHIRSKNTARSSYLFIYGHEHSDVQKTQASFCPNIFC